MLLDLPDVRQEESFDCGQAVVKTVCDFFGVSSLKNNLRKLLGTNHINGTDPRTIEAFLRGEGFRVISGEMTVADLDHLTKRGAPVICLVTLASTGHYVVAKGRQWNHVHFQDPNVGPAKLRSDKFEGVWIDFDRYGCVYRNFGLAVWK